VGIFAGYPCIANICSDNWATFSSSKWAFCYWVAKDNPPSNLLAVSMAVCISPGFEA